MPANEAAVPASQSINEQSSVTNYIYYTSQVGIDIDLNVGDIRHATSTYVIPISESNMSDWKTSFRYRNCSYIDIRVHSDIRHWRKKNISSCRFEPMTLGKVSECYYTRLLWLSVWNGMLDIGYRKKLSSDIDIMLDSALTVRYWKFRYQAQSYIADHGYRTKCPPMLYLPTRMETKHREMSDQTRHRT